MTLGAMSMLPDISKKITKNTLDMQIRYENIKAVIIKIVLSYNDYANFL